jgi:hypothetical protein
MGARDLVTAPSHQERVDKDPLIHIVIRTILGAYYTMPDMTQEMVHEMLAHLDQDIENLVVRNLSEATLVIPVRIIESVARLDIADDARIHATSPHGSRGVIWGVGG